VQRCDFQNSFNKNLGISKHYFIKICVPKEIHKNECHVAVTSDTATWLQNPGFETVIKTGAGDNANYLDDAYSEAGVIVMTDAIQSWSSATIILKVRAPGQFKRWHCLENRPKKSKSILPPH
jgi:NAD/NADP transhydrogenase alpha subunit